MSQDQTDPKVEEARERLKKLARGALAFEIYGGPLASLDPIRDDLEALLAHSDKQAEEIERLKPTPCPHEHLHSVVYRTGKPTAADYNEAITDLLAAKRGLEEGDSMGCRICEDGGHGADMCHHNPLLLARKWTAASSFWQCWHCGYVATNDAEGREHFGDHDGEPPSCIKAELIARAEAAEQDRDHYKGEMERLKADVRKLKHALPDCHVCGGSGHIDHEAKTTGANQHSACREVCDHCDGQGVEL